MNHPRGGGLLKIAPAPCLMPRYSSPGGGFTLLYGFPGKLRYNLTAV